MLIMLIGMCDGYELRSGEGEGKAGTARFETRFLTKHLKLGTAKVSGKTTCTYLCKQNAGDYGSDNYQRLTRSVKSFWISRLKCRCAVVSLEMDGPDTTHLSVARALLPCTCLSLDSCNKRACRHHVQDTTVHHDAWRCQHFSCFLTASLIDRYLR